LIRRTEGKGQGLFFRTLGENHKGFSLRSEYLSTALFFQGKRKIMNDPCGAPVFLLFLDENQKGYGEIRGNSERREPHRGRAPLGSETPEHGPVLQGLAEGATRLVRQSESQWGKLFLNLIRLP